MPDVTDDDVAQYCMSVDASFRTMSVSEQLLHPEGFASIQNNRLLTLMITNAYFKELRSQFGISIQNNAAMRLGTDFEVVEN